MVNARRAYVTVGGGVKISYWDTKLFGYVRYIRLLRFKFCTNTVLQKQFLCQILVYYFAIALLSYTVLYEHFIIIIVIFK